MGAGRGGGEGGGKGGEGGGKGGEGVGSVNPTKGGAGSTDGADRSIVCVGNMPIFSASEVVGCTR